MQLEEAWDVCVCVRVCVWVWGSGRVNFGPGCPRTGLPFCMLCVPNRDKEDVECLLPVQNRGGDFGTCLIVGFGLNPSFCPDRFIEMIQRFEGGCKLRHWISTHRLG